MSSKSASRTQAEHAATQEHDDELIVTKVGHSKARFLMILGLMVFTLIVFVIPGSFQSAFRSGSSIGETILSFRGPDGSTVERDWASFIDAKRRLDDFYRVQGLRVDIEDDDVATFLVLDELARAEGIEVSNREVADAILTGFIRPGSKWGIVRPLQTKEAYEQTLAGWRIKAQRFEGTVRQVLRVERYKSFLSAAACWPEPTEIEASWKESHQEYAYEYVEIPSSAFEEAAAADLPADEELATWYEELPARRSVFDDEFRQAKTAATLIGIRAGGDEDGAGLLARYPRPEDEDPTELARTYYDEVAHRRFVRPEPLEGVELASERLYFPFEEVQAEAEREAPLQRALVEWLQDLQNRMADGEEVDLAAEAAELGLHHEADGVAREHQEWVDHELGGPFVASALRSPGPNGLTDNVVTDKGGLFVGLVTETVEAGLPPFEEIRERVVEEWTKERAGELALEAAEQLREALLAQAEPAPEDEDDDADPAADAEPAMVVSAETFRSAAEAAGWTVGTRDWLSGYTFTSMDFQGQSFQIPESPLSKDPNGEEPANAYIAGQMALEDLPAGGLSEAGLANDGEHAYVVRSLGSRDPAAVRMSREDWDEARMQAFAEKAVEFEERFFGRERLERDYDLVLSLDDENEGELNAEGELDPDGEPEPETES